MPTLCIQYSHFLSFFFWNTQRASILKTYKKAGRWIVRIYGPWIDLNEAFRLGLFRIYGLWIDPTESFHLGLAEDGLFEISDEFDDDE